MSGAGTSWRDGPSGADGGTVAANPPEPLRSIRARGDGSCRPVEGSRSDNPDSRPVTAGTAPSGTRGRGGKEGREGVGRGLRSATQQKTCRWNVSFVCTPWEFHVVTQTPDVPKSRIAVVAVPPGLLPKLLPRPATNAQSCVPAVKNTW
jgi:hypothetical protein